VDSLVKEIRLVASELRTRPRIGHLHWGGGSPTLLTPADVGRIHGALTNLFALDPSSESAVEIDPRTLVPELAAAFARAGVNRASLGVQSFDPVVQVAINRVQSFETTAAAVRMLRERGIPAINFDLVYGLPFQSVQSCLDTVEQAVRLQPDRLAVFGYAHVPEVKPHQRLIDETALPGPAERLAQAEVIAEELDRAGYVRVGLDHFALPADPMVRALRAGMLRRNFQGYTTDAADMLFGVGTSSIGALPQGYAQNEAATPAWRDAVRAGRLPIRRGVALTAEDRLRRAVIERLMCDGTVDLDTVAAAHGADPAGLREAGPALAAMAQDGLLHWDGRVVRLSATGRPFVRNVAAAFDRYLRPEAGRHARAV